LSPLSSLPANAVVTSDHALYTYASACGPAYSNSKSKRHLRWLVFGSSTYYLYAFVASILTALMSSLI
jgi:hypothetical protein